MLGTERHGALASIVLDRPAVMNAINSEMIDGLDRELDLIQATPDIAVVLLEGNGRSFCAGSDLREVTADAPARLRRMHRLILRLRRFDRPVVAVLHGHVLGGGLELALGCTFRVATPDALLGLPEIRLGAIPAYGGTQLLPRLIGEARALDMMLSGEPVTAARGYEIGLVDHLLPGGSDRSEAARQFAGRFAAHGAFAGRALKQAVMEGVAQPLEAALEIELEHVLLVTQGDEFRRKLAAFRSSGAAGLN